MDDLSYEQFLKEIAKLGGKISVVPSDISFVAKKSAREVYNELCYDYPLVSQKELEILRDHLLQYVNRLTKGTSNTKQNDFRILRRSFVDGIIYGAQKLSTKSENKGNSFASSSIDLLQITKS